MKFGVMGTLAALALSPSEAFVPSLGTVGSRNQGLGVSAGAHHNSVKATALRTGTPLYGVRSFEEEMASIEAGKSGEGADGGVENKGKKEKVEGLNRRVSRGSVKVDVDRRIDAKMVKLETEITFFEGGPDASEVVAPAISVLTVIGIVPFSAALARQAWVKYTITSRRIKVVSGWNGQDTTEVVYPDITDMVFVWRFFGRCGDLVLTLRDGSKLEIRSLPEFERNYNYILERCSQQCQERAQKITPSENTESSGSVAETSDSNAP